MKGSTTKSGLIRGSFLFLSAIMLFTAVGCQYDVGGQMLPSAYYIYDDVQYFPEGPEFKHAREAAAIEEASQEEALIGR